MTEDNRAATPPMVKVLFYPNDGYYTSPESLWAEALGDGRYRIRNSPWYIYGIGFEDVVRAHPDASGMLEFDEVVERSGSSTFRIMLRDGTDEAKFQRFWQPLQDLGCTYEHAKGRLLAIDAPPGVDLDQVAALLAEGEKAAVWDWETGYWHDTASGGPLDTASATEPS